MHQSNIHESCVHSVDEYEYECNESTARTQPTKCTVHPSKNKKKTFDTKSVESITVPERPEDAMKRWQRYVMKYNVL